jgi:nucleoside-diphosphate-sugar epimerase
MVEFCGAATDWRRFALQRTTYDAQPARGLYPLNSQTRSNMGDRLLFLTGGTGFIGRQLLARLALHPSLHVRCLSRGATGVPGPTSGLEIVVGDLCVPATYSEALRGSDLVVHLAAATGKARPAEYSAVNVGGTRALLDACRRADVRRLIFVSSIAATYQDKTAYYYAQSKQQAEQAVRDSGLNYLIVRPTLVLGPGSPLWNKLVALAGLPVMPVFGDGQVRVQPIHVNDVVTFLMSMIEDPTLPDGAIDLGGPDVVTFETLLRRIRRALNGRDGPIMHLPARRAIALLAWLERWLYPIIPITAGQLSAFVNDGVAAYDPLVADRVPRMRTIDEMLELLVAHG